MALVRTNVTLPAELLHQIDEIAGPRGRSQYVAEALARQVKRDRLKKALDETAGVLIGTAEWMNDEQALEFAKGLRASWDRP